MRRWNTYLIGLAGILLTTFSVYAIICGKYDVSALPFNSSHSKDSIFPVLVVGLVCLGIAAWRRKGNGE